MADHGGQSLDRRHLLGVLGSSALVGLAGCSDGDDDEDDEDEEDDEFEPNMEHPGDEPVDFSDEQSCPVCSMTPTDYPDLQSQIAHDDGQGAAFDSPGCMLAYYVNNSSDADPEGAWTIDHETGDLIDATEAHFVIITDEDEANDPMGIDPRVFEDEDDAREFMEEWDAEDLSEDDIIGFEEIDYDVALIYRPSHLDA